MLLERESKISEQYLSMHVKDMFEKSTISLIAFILETSILNECCNEEYRK